MSGVTVIIFKEIIIKWTILQEAFCSLVGENDLLVKMVKKFKAGNPIDDRDILLQSNNFPFGIQYLLSQCFLADHVGGCINGRYNPPKHILKIPSSYYTYGFQDKRWGGLHDDDLRSLLSFQDQTIEKLTFPQNCDHFIDSLTAFKQDLLKLMSGYYDMEDSGLRLVNVITFFKQNVGFLVNNDITPESSDQIQEFLKICLCSDALNEDNFKIFQGLEPLLISFVTLLFEKAQSLTDNQLLFCSKIKYLD